MPQILCPSPSSQLAAASLAFHRARRKFPKNIGASACARDSSRIPKQAYSMISKGKIPAHKSQDQRQGNYASYPSLASSNTVSVSNDYYGGGNVCGACAKRNNLVKLTQQRVYGLRRDSTQIAKPRGIAEAESRESSQSREETASKSTHSSTGAKKKKHRRSCVHDERIRRRNGSRSPSKIQGNSKICLLHGFHATERRRSYRSKPLSSKTQRTEKKLENIYPNDSPTLAGDFSTKLKTWEHRSQRGMYQTENCSQSRQREHKKTCPKHWHQNSSAQVEYSALRLDKSSLEAISDADECLRPSLIKAAQQKLDSGVRERGRNFRSSKHSDENLNVIRHKDSLSILMERFRKTNCGEGEPSLFRSGKIDSKTNQSILQKLDDAEYLKNKNNFPTRKNSSSFNPVAKLGRVANQALRDSENRFKYIKSRINRSTGVCSSSAKGIPSWR